MIVSQDIKPERQVYRIGASILFELQACEEIDAFELYHKVHSKSAITLGLFMLSLDWLYILGAIENNKGVLRSCS